MKEQIQLGMLRGLLRMPEGVLQAMFGPPPVNDRGARLDLETHVFLQILERTGPQPVYEQELAEGRRLYDVATAQMGVKPEPIYAVRDRTVPGEVWPIPMRVYRPVDEPVLPGCVFFHGGGFVLGTLDAYDGLCRFWARRTGCVVVSVDYRRAPEHRFPAAVEDAVAAFSWVREHAEELGVDPLRLAVAGDSAGGNLSAVVSQQLRNAGKPSPAAQMLLWPSTDRARTYPSQEHFREGFYLTNPLLEWFTRTYVGDSDVSDPRISPLRADDLSGLPPAWVVTAGFDPLRDEAEAYADALSEAGVQVMRRPYDGLIHGFGTMAGLIDAGARAMEELADELRRFLAENPDI